MRPDPLAAAGERVYLRLRARLATLLGAAGFDALWARAIHLAQPTLRLADDTAAEEAVRAGAYGLRAALRGQDSAGVQQALTAVFASFISLLYTFIGEDLGARFIRQLWPDLPPDAEESCAEEPTP